jgi:hypothetical protein
VLEDPVVLPERDVVLEERRLRIDNEPRHCSANSYARRCSRITHRNPTSGGE